MEPRDSTVKHASPTGELMKVWLVVFTIEMVFLGWLSRRIKESLQLPRQRL